MPNLVGSVRKREKYKWPEPAGTPPAMMWIDKEELYIDPRYQRDVKSSKKALDIARNFDWMLCGALRCVLRPGGEIVVVDGQHRAVAASYRDDVESLPCVVFEWDSLSDEARAFVGANTMSSKVSMYDRHHAGLVAQDPIALSAQEILDSVGYQFTKSTEKTGMTSNAVSTIHDLVKKDRELASKVVRLAAETAHGGPLKQSILWAISYIGQRDESLFAAPHRQRLIDLGREVVEAEIERRRIIMRVGGAKVCGEALADLLNKGRRTNKLALTNGAEQE